MSLTKTGSEIEINGSERAFEPFSIYDLESSASDVLKASFNYPTTSDIAIDVVNKRDWQQSAENPENETERLDNPLVPIDEAKTYAQENNADLDFSEWKETGISKKSLFLLVERKQAENLNDFILGQAPQDMMTTTFYGLVLAGGFSASLTDPIEFGVGLLTGFVGGNIAKGAYIAERSRKALNRALLAKRMKGGAIGGLVGGAAVETLYYPLTQEMQMNYEISDSAINITIGGLLGGTLAPIAGKIKDKRNVIKMSKRMDIVKDQWNNIDPKLKERIFVQGLIDYETTGKVDYKKLVKMTHLDNVGNKIKSGEIIPVKVKIKPEKVTDEDVKKQYSAVEVINTTFTATKKTTKGGETILTKGDIPFRLKKDAKKVAQKGDVIEKVKNGYVIKTKKTTKGNPITSVNNKQRLLDKLKNRGGVDAYNIHESAETVTHFIDKEGNTVDINKIRDEINKERLTDYKDYITKQHIENNTPAETDIKEPHILEKEIDNELDTKISEFEAEFENTTPEQKVQIKDFLENDPDQKELNEFLEILTAMKKGCK